MPKRDSTPKDSKRARQKGEKMMDLPASKLRIPADAGGHRQRQQTGHTAQLTSTCICTQLHTQLTSGYDREHTETLNNMDRGLIEKCPKVEPKGDRPKCLIRDVQTH